jgi:hypothetical protein
VLQSPLQERFFAFRTSGQLCSIVSEFDAKPLASPFCFVRSAAVPTTSFTTTWFERKLVFFKQFKRPKFLILGKFCIHPPGGQGPRAHLIWAIISFPNLFLALNFSHFAQKDQLGVLLRTMGNRLSTHPENLVVYG